MGRVRRNSLNIVALLFLAGCGGSGDTVVKATGQVVNPDKVAGIFTLSPLNASSGFTPAGSSVSVRTEAATSFHDRAGSPMTASQWYDFVAQNAGPSTAAQATGVYASGVITAFDVELR